MRRTTNNTGDKVNDDILLEIRDLHIEGRADETWQRIVNGVDVTLRRGEVLGLIGESGAGKTTIGLAAMGYTRDGCRISNGTIRFHDIDLVKASEKQRRALLGVRIAYVAQSAAAAFNPAHKLLDQHSETGIQHGVLSREEARADAMELYERLHMPDPQSIALRYPHQVSGGQLQRAMTAMALSCRPELVIFDEPTTALDVTTQIEVLAAIKSVVEQFRTAAIYISHDLALVAQMADRIMVFRNGDLIEEGQTRELLARPKERYTQDLLAVRTFHKADTPAETSEVPLLEIRNLTAAYGKSPVLFDVSFSVPRGKTVALVGESGSGKSTTARVISGLLSPSEGQVLYQGVPLLPTFAKRTKTQLRRIQMIYQTPDTSLNPKQRIRKTVGRPLAFYLGMNSADRDSRVRELLSLVELEPNQYIDRLPGELSGGEKQRVCIARALAAEPELIVCDEVTSALDQLVAEEILKLLDRLQREFNLSYIFITHDIGTVRAIADDVVVMSQGEVVEMGPKTEMFVPPHHEYTDLLLSSVPEMDPDWLDNLLAGRTNQTGDNHSRTDGLTS
jgi:peptide/nickel transport system ATP-binding protein